MGKAKATTTKAKGGAKAPAVKAVTFVVTQELFDLNVDFFKENGVEVGNEIEATKEVKESLTLPEGFVFGAPVAEKPEDKKNLGSTGVKCPVSILKGKPEEGAEYVRTYPKGQEAQAQEFLLKNPDCTGVSPDKILSIAVSWRENETKVDPETRRTIDTGKVVTRNFHFSEKNNGETFKEQARDLASEGPKRSCVATVA